MSIDFSNYRILVLGDAFLDEYQFGECTRISQEAPVPIIQIDHAKTKHVPGGAGNVAVNVRSLGAQCTLGGRFGVDFNGKGLASLLRRNGVSTISSSAWLDRTIVKTRIIAQNQQVVRLDSESVAHSQIENWTNELQAIKTCDAVILSDYAKGYFNRKYAEEIIEMAKAHNKLVIVDTKPCNVEWFRGADWFTPNSKEYHESGDFPYNKVLITKGPEGMVCHYENKIYSVSAIRREVVDVSGAGDTVVAAFTLALVSKMSIEEAVNFANKAAGVVVGKQGTSTVTVQEIESLEKEIYGTRIEDSAK